MSSSSTTLADQPRARVYRRQGIYWILTVPHHCFTPFLPVGVAWIRGQLELGAGSTPLAELADGFLHWQFIVGFRTKQSLRAVVSIFGPYHAELTRSAAAEDYVWKEDTAIANTRFELGQKAFQRSSDADWQRVWDLAIKGEFLSIPASIRVSHYGTLRKVHQDNVQPVAIERAVHVFWGKTGSGKSRRAWEEAGMDAYPKAPTTKFWCGYTGQLNVVIDEFRGDVSISHLLRWLDRYPVLVEVKGSGTALSARQIWITSNLPPRSWYPDLDEETYSALFRRFTSITEFV